MAKNIIQGGVGNPIIIQDMLVLYSPQTTDAHALSGDPVIAIGNIPGVAENDYDTVTGYTPVNVNCIATFVVKGVDKDGNSAVAAGDKLYLQTDGTINKDVGGILFGKAFGNDVSSSATGVDTRSGTLVSSGNTTTTIRVWVGAPGS
jgi:hypothetical protein